ncbi:SCO1/SenC-domain-containing protein, partial [Piptocephalis cylindrospora]
PFTWQAGVLFLATSIGLVVYFRHAKGEAERARMLPSLSVGKKRPKVGGPFQLTDHEGKRRTNEDFLGQWMLVYFGFTHCPDICPEELDKMADVVDNVDTIVAKGEGKTIGEGSKAAAITPLFITCDPRRDSVDQVAAYIKEFHPRLVGLTGSEEEISKACRAYRVYHSSPPNLKPGEDYLVDHSIFFYLMHPDGSFADAYGKDQSAAAVTESVLKHQASWAPKS